MKVYMGKYKNYLGPYQLAEKICFWAKKDLIEGNPKYVQNLGQIFAHGKVLGDDDFNGPVPEATRLYKFLEWLHEKRGERRIYVKIDDCDVWSMEHSLSHIITPMLKKLKEVQHGAPYTDDEDVPEELRSTACPPKENSWDLDENHFKRWDWILDEMIWSFEQCRVDDMSLFFNDDTKTFDDQALRRHDNRKKNGHRLFGKYYTNLWD